MATATDPVANVQMIALHDIRHDQNSAGTRRASPATLYSAR